MGVTEVPVGLDGVLESEPETSLVVLTGVVEGCDTDLLLAGCVVRSDGLLAVPVLSTGLRTSPPGLFIVAPELMGLLIVPLVCKSSFLSLVRPDSSTVDGTFTAFVSSVVIVCSFPAADLVPGLFSPVSEGDVRGLSVPEEPSRLVGVRCRSKTSALFTFGVRSVTLPRVRSAVLFGVPDLGVGWMFAWARSITHPLISSANIPCLSHSLRARSLSDCERSPSVRCVLGNEGS